MVEEGDFFCHCLEILIEDVTGAYPFAGARGVHFSVKTGVVKPAPRHEVLMW